MTTTSSEFELLTDDEFGELSGAAKITRATWRRKGLGPRFIKIGRRVFYRRAEIDAWLLQQEARTNAERRMRVRDQERTT